MSEEEEQKIKSACLDCFLQFLLLSQGPQYRSQCFQYDQKVPGSIRVSAMEMSMVFRTYSYTILRNL